MPDNIKGGTYTGPDTHVPTIWKCPACSAENAGRLELGCVSCGSGKPGFKITVPAVTIPKEIPNFALDAFKEFLSQTPELSNYDHGVEIDALWKAFQAGMEYAMQTGIPVTLPGTAESRTLAAALAQFIEQILSQGPEEIASGEWLSEADARALLRKLEAQ